MGLINNTVKLENNFVVWTRLFEEEKKNLEQIFKEEHYQIEHVGSTAVNNLQAKPIIDIAVGIDNYNSINKYRNILSNIYTIKTSKEEILLIKENEQVTFYLIHIMLKNSERFLNMIKFRDLLINNYDIKKDYEELKIKLANKYPNNRKKYLFKNY